MPRVAVIGCGRWGGNHVRTLAELGALAAICDQNEDVARQMADVHGVASARVDDVLADRNIDGLVLALPAEHNRTVAEAALSAGKHVLVEKPIALTGADARAMTDLASDMDRVLMVGHILLYHAAFMAVETLVAAGRIGPVRHIQSNRLGFGKFYDRFDALWDLAPHDLSLVLRLAGTSPVRVDGHPVSVTGGQTDMAHVHLAFENGPTAHIHVSRHSPYPERRLVVTGETGTIVWDDTADWPQKVCLVPHHVERGQDGHWEAEKGSGEMIAVEPNMALTDELTHFLDCIGNGTAPRTPARQGLDVVDILEKAVHPR